MVFFRKRSRLGIDVPDVPIYGAPVKKSIAASALAISLVLGQGHCLRAADAPAPTATKRMAYAYVIPAHLTPEEKGWFKTFQEGNFLSIGWQEISAEIMDKTPPEQKDAQLVALENLGTKIGLEWCRPNAVRKVNSSMLKEWGDILRNTARTNPAQLASAIAFIDRKVDSVLD